MVLIRNLNKTFKLNKLKYGCLTSRNISFTCNLNNAEPDLMKSLTNKKTSHASTISNFHLVNHTLRDLIDINAEQAPNELLFAFPHQRLNLKFGELKQRVDAFVSNLTDLGLKKGDRVAFALPNCHELAVAYLAAANLGLISVLLNPAYQITEFEYMLKKTGCKALFIYDTFKHLNHLELVRKLCPEIDSSKPGELNSKVLPDLRHVVVLNSPLVPEKKTYKGTYDFNKFIQPKSQSSNIELPYLDIDDPNLILFTSGTTGKPKGALMTNSSLLNSGYLTTKVGGRPENLTMVCSPIPFFHIYGFVSGLLIPILNQSASVFPFYFPETGTSMKAIQDFKCITLRGTPTQFFDLLHHPDRKKFDLSSLRNVIFGGSTAPPELLQQMNQNFTLENIIIGYGMTETSMCHSITNEYDQKRSFKKAFESIGRGLPFTQTKIVDVKTRQIVPLQTDGELLVKGPHIFKGYWDEKEKTDETFENGWLKTGDICSMDEDGYIYFKSRDKEVIIRGGANLYPAEIETFLRTNPQILDAQVFGVPDERMGEEICTWIKLKPESKLTAEELKSFCKSKISQFKIPKYIKFVDKFPINANNKILKLSMKEQTISELNLKK
ncbi:unnamed protein product [Brachionus calyciflorus]|uniref:Medium-chain acyl-CoA ligase ACSF2, mitochondrial n=1 Tax=Brachionus calyciflorus TaxID=104777 RepID=A0A813Y075_9BILA|nr:unnamed protein product [Brachionus calyciflorus]